MSASARRSRKSKGELSTPNIPQVNTSPESAVTDSPRQQPQKTKSSATKRKRRNNGDSDDEGGQPAPARPKKSRVVSCEQCRKRKSKCDHLRPMCTACKLLGAECMYLAGAQPVPNLSGQGGDMLPVLVNRLRGVLGEMESMATTRMIVPRDHTLARSTSFALNADGFFTGPSSIASYGSAVLIPGVSALHLAIAPPPSPGPEYLDLSAFVDSAPTGSLSIEAPVLVEEPALDLPVALRSDPGTSVLLQEGSLRELVNFYGTQVAKEFRFVDIADLDGEILRHRTSPLLMMVCAIAKLHQRGMTSMQDAEQYYSWACMAMQDPSSYHQKIENVETSLLHAQYLFTLCVDIEKIWNIVGACMRLVLSLGLHRESRGAQTPPKEEQERRRWALHNALLLDRWVAFITGRPIALRNRDFDTLHPDAAEGGDEHKYRMHVTLFRLSDVLGDILAESSSSYVAPFETAQAFDKQITELLSSIHASLARGQPTLGNVAIHSMALHMRAMVYKPYIHLDECEALYEEDKEETVQMPDSSADAISAVCDAAAELLKAVHEVYIIDNQGSFSPGRLPWVPYHIDVAMQLIAAHSPETFAVSWIEAMQVLDWFHVSSGASLVREKVAKLWERHGPLPGVQFPLPFAQLPMSWQSTAPRPERSRDRRTPELWNPDGGSYPTVIPEVINPSLLMNSPRVSATLPAPNI